MKTVCISAFVLLMVYCANGETSIKKLEELRQKLDGLHKVLDDLNNNIVRYADKLENDASENEDKREVIPEPRVIKPRMGYQTKRSCDVDALMQGLSEADQELLQKNPGMLKFLMMANPDLCQEDRAEKRQINPNFQSFYDSLSPEEQEMVDSLAETDLELLQKYPSSWKFLKAAMESGPQTEEQRREELAPEEAHVVGEAMYDTSDRDMLTRVKSKLEYLKNTLQDYKQQKQQADDSKRELEVSEGRFGEFVDKREARGSDSGWGDAPAAESQLGTRGKASVNDVRDKFMKDMQYARMEGINLRDILKALQQRKQERQLELLDRSN